MISLLSFSSALLIWSCSVWQTASRCSWYNFSVLGLWQAGPLPFTCSILGNCLHQDPFQQGRLQPFAGEIWGWLGSIYSSLEDRCKLMLTINQAHLPNQGKSVSRQSLGNMPCLLCFILCQPADLGDGARAQRAQDCLEAHTLVQVLL